MHAHTMPAMAPPCRASPLSLAPQPWPPCPSSPPRSSTSSSTNRSKVDALATPEDARPKPPVCRSRRDHARHGRALATRHPASTRSPWTPCEHLEPHRDTATPLDTPSTTTRTRRRRRSQPWSAAGATDMEATRHNQALPDHAVATIRLAWTRRASLHPRLAR
jgi:hypothetical protein